MRVLMRILYPYNKPKIISCIWHVPPFHIAIFDDLAYNVIRISGKCDRYREETMNTSHISGFNERQTMQSLDFEIYHYDDASPCNVTLHHHDFFEIYYLLGGSMDYIVEGNRFTLMPGDLLLISPLDLHRPDPREQQNFERIVLWISMPYLALLTEVFPGMMTTLLSRTATGRQFSLTRRERACLEVLLFSLLEERSDALPDSQAMCRALLTCLLIHLHRRLMALPDRQPAPAIASRSRRTRTTPPLPSPLFAVFEFIDTNLCEDLSLNRLAERFFQDANTLSRRFKREVGITIGEYIRKKRLALARVKIAQGMSATQAGATSGFSDYSSFFRAFKSEYGINPREFAARFK